MSTLLYKSVHTMQLNEKSACTLVNTKLYITAGFGPARPSLMKGRLSSSCDMILTAALTEVGTTRSSRWGERGGWPAVGR
jgi:hypothetical protein